MSGVRYYNQSAPFWDFVATLEEQGRSHPFFAGNNRGSGEESDNEQQRPNPWTEGWNGFPCGPFPHRGRHSGPGRHHQHPPPPPPGDYPMGPPPPPGYEEHPGEDEAQPEQGRDPQEGPSSPGQGHPGPHHERCGRHARHAHGGSGGPGLHHGPGRRGGGRGRGGFGGRGGHGGPFGQHPPSFGPMGGFGGLAEMFQSQLFGDNNNTTDEKNDDFKPELDVFDTNEGFVVHVSLPGAEKEDVGVNWDAEKSELAIAGVVYRPADEEQLKSLALDERKVGAFDRKVRLGSRANPAQVDVDAISAKLEDGILRVDVPKLDSGYVEIKKVDIE